MRASAADDCISTCGSLSKGIKLEIATLADLPIFPSALAANLRTPASASLSKGIKLGIAESPIFPTASVATSGTQKSESLNKEIRLGIFASGCFRSLIKLGTEFPAASTG